MNKKLNFTLIIILIFFLSSCDAFGEPDVAVTFFNYEEYNLVGKPGDSLSLPNNINRQGYLFDGWYLDPNLSFEARILEFPEDNITLYPKWDKLVTLNFLDSEIDSVQLVSGDDYRLPIPNDNQNKYFGGWYFDNSFLNKAGDSITIPSTDTNLYALWYNDFDLVIAYGIINGEYSYDDNEKSHYYNVFFPNNDYSVWIYENGLLKFFYFPSVITIADVALIAEFYFDELLYGFDFYYRWDGEGTFGDSNGGGNGIYLFATGEVVAYFDYYNGRTRASDLELAESVAEGLFQYVSRTFQNEIGVTLR